MCELVCLNRRPRPPGGAQFRLTQQSAGGSVPVNIGFHLVFCPWLGCAGGHDFRALASASRV